MQKIRFGVFETNSSNTHSLTIVTEKAFEAWKRGELIFNSEYDVEEIQTEEEFVKSFNEDKYTDSLEEYRKDNAQTFEQWEDDDCLETFEYRYTTESGDKIVIFGKYGHEC
jgi:hypothetical protein